MSSSSSIVIWNRKESREEVEQVYGDAALKWVYGTRSGQRLADRVLSRGFISQAYGAYQSSSWSAHKIEPFIRTFQIPMDEYEVKSFRTFNEFFIRKFKPGAREFTKVPNELPAFSEARYFAYEKITPDQKFPVKGTGLSAEGLLGSREKAKPFQGGPLLLARLCPVDYHRFHFPDEGRIMDYYPVHGKLHSVNPLALKYKEEIFITNERQVSILQTPNFGKLAYIEVGALCVGKIVQTHPTLGDFRRGDEKGYFLFGGSTVIVLGEPGAWKPDQDLLDQTSQGRETLVRLGERVATATSVRRGRA
jgi:phosphatidylserine decarboxylase